MPGVLFYGVSSERLAVNSIAALVDGFEKPTIVDAAPVDRGLTDFNTIDAMSLVRRLRDILAEVFAQHGGQFARTVAQ